jgi:TonB-linked SusC/RagA family outer membrane protein
MKQMRFLLLILPLLLLTGIVDAQKKSITGLVTDKKTGAPLDGANVVVEKTKNGVTTKLDGTFTISIDASVKNLTISYVGYVSQVVSVDKRSNLQISLVSISESGIQNEVVVIGYGTQRKKDLSGSVASVNMSEMMKAPVKSFDDALSGRVAGVQVVSPDGQPGASPTIVIRGGNSVTQDNSPLYVIDGFPIEKFNNNSLNPADIESIDILKDASSTAIYGARGANGVIMITTKKGKIGRPVLSYSTYYGLQSNTNKVDMMNAYDYLKYTLEVDAINNVASDYVLYNINHPTLNPTGTGTIDDYITAPSIDWQSQIFQQSAMKNHAFAIRGGTTQTRYTLSGSYLNQTGNVIASGFKRYQMRMTLDQNLNDKLKVGINANYSNTITSGTQVGGTFTTADPLLISTWRYRPVVPFGANVEALLNAAQDDAVITATNYQWNPKLTATEQLSDIKSNLLTTNAYLDLAISPSLKFRSTEGINTNFTETDLFNTSLSRLGSPTSTLGQGGPNGTVAHNKVINIISENTLTYNKIFSKVHSLNVVGGFSFGENSISSNRFSALKVPNESLGVNGLGQGTPAGNITTKSSNKMASFLGRASYSYDNKYLATASFRADGSSKFLGDNVWGYFPSASVAWHLSKEKFLMNSTIISDAKIRASYGVIGNNRVSDAAAYSLLSTGATSGGLAGSYPIANNLINATYPSNLANPALKWESTAEKNIGLDLGILDQRITMTFDVYVKKTSNLLLNASLPGTAGYLSAYENIGEVQNKGVEFSITTQNIRNKNFTWNTSFNISANENKVLSLTSGQDYLTTVVKWLSGNTIAASPGFIAQIGKPIGMFYGLESDGVYQFSDFTQNPSTGVYVLNTGISTYGAAGVVKPGAWKFKDQNGDGVIDVNDAKSIGNPNPKLIGGFNNTITYKNFDFNIFFQFSFGNQIMNVNRILLEGGGGISVMQGANQSAKYADRWTPTNPSNVYARAGSTAVPAFYPSRVIEDGSYVRLKTLNIGYNFNSEKLQKIGISNFRMYLSGQNLLTFTKYSGLDPEVNSFSSALTPGVDYSAYPRAKVITVGLDVSF